MAVLLLYLFVTCYSDAAEDPFLWISTDNSLFGTSFAVILFLFIAGLYMCAVAFYYAYCRNGWIHPYRLLARRIVSMSTLMVSVFPMFLLSLFAYKNLPSFIIGSYIDVSELPHMLLMLCAWIAMPTLCIYVFIYSRPDRYCSTFLNNNG